MSTTDRSGAFTRGDPISRFLLDLAAGREVRLEGSVPAGLVELAQRHGLIPILSRVTADPLVRAISAREIARSLILESHLERILTTFRDQGIRVAVLKGPMIASQYPDRSLRPFGDVDLLVPASEVDKALDVLAADPAALHVPEKRPKADKRDVLFSDEAGIWFNVDLHWDLYSYSQLLGSADGAIEAAWEAASFDDAAPLGPVWEIPDSYRVAFLAAHAVLDHRFRLILFRDFREMTRHGVDWGDLNDVAGRWGLRSTTYLALWISKEALGVDVPEAFLATM